MVIALLFALAAFAAGVFIVRKRWRFTDTPTSDAAHVFPGLTEVHGVVEAIGQPANSPSDGADCVWWMYAVERWQQNNKSGHWVTEEKGVTAMPFLVRDASGTVKVNIDERVVVNGAGKHDVEHLTLDFLRPYARTITKTYDPINLFGWDLSRNLQITENFSINSLFLYYYFFLLCVAGSILFVQRLQISRIGRAWAAMRDDELAAKAIGINTRNMKLLAFSLGATFGGVAGALFGAFQGFVSPESFSLMESIAVLTMVVFGGMGNIAGAVVGAFVLALLPEILRDVAVPLQQTLFGHVLLDPEVLRMLLLSLAMILMMLLRPAGMIPARARYCHDKHLSQHVSNTLKQEGAK